MTERSKKLYRAWIDYCATNRLIAYGEKTDEEWKQMSEQEQRDYVEKRALDMYEEDCKRINEEYKDESTYC